METNLKRGQSQQVNLKKLPERIFVPEKPVNTSKNASGTPPSSPSFKRWKYKDYLRKFDATTIYERTERRIKRSGKNVSRDVIYDEVMKGLDPTDELLKFRVEKSNWRELFGPQYRRTYLPPGTFLPRDHVKYGRPDDYTPRQYTTDNDIFGVRPRVFELMKQIIYQVRDKMTYMQKLREQHNHSAVFRMGFLFSKTDQVLKDHHSISYKTYYICSGVRQYAYKFLDIIHVLEGYERSVNHWFEAELLWDLIIKNDRKCKDIIAEHFLNRKEKFNKVYVN